MGIDAGFDMVPRLSRGAIECRNWESFLNIIKDRYADDELVELKPNYILFKVGEHPTLPYEGHKFLRFSSKLCRGADEYIDTVTTVAKCCFGSRVKYWHEGCDQLGIYNWGDVHKSIKSYEQPDEPMVPSSIAGHLFGTDPLGDLNLELFEIRPVPGKGKGLLARFNIVKGKRILSERPILKTPNTSSMSLLNQSIATKLKELPRAEQRQFLSLHNNFPGSHPFAGIVKTNALPCGPDSPIGAVYPTICLINHSCHPNAQNNWNSETNTETIHALRTIQAGEEITISYSTDGPTAARQTHLKANFGFPCTCEVCSLPALDLHSSDTRRLSIQRLDRAIGDPQRVMTDPHACLADCARLLQLLHEEFTDTASPLLARLYYDALQISITHGDQARASAFAERGYKARVICEGEDSPGAQKMKALMENPAGHRNFGASGRWRTTKKLMPKGLDEGAFEKWLWRQ